MVEFNVFMMTTLMIPTLRSLLPLLLFSTVAYRRRWRRCSRHTVLLLLRRRQMVIATCNNVVANFSNYGLKVVFTGDAWPACSAVWLAIVKRLAAEKKPSLIDWKF